jgi:hypothetical protein
MLLRAPLLPRGGRYLRSGALDGTGDLGNLPFVSLRLAAEGEGSSRRALAVTVQECVRLPRHRSGPPTAVKRH